jgi:two-component system, OmpR family, sensor histidine kinase BaeS
MMVDVSGHAAAATVGRRRVSPLTVRLAVAFLAVAVGALAVLTVITLLTARGGFSELTDRQQQATLQRVVSLAAAAYEQAGGWEQADLHPAVAVAAADGGGVSVLDAAGEQVPFAPMAGMGDMGDMGDMGPMDEMMSRMHGPAPEQAGQTVERTVEVDGEVVGSVAVWFAVDESVRAELQLRDALTRNVLVAAGFAGVVALVATGLVAGRLTRPLTRLTATVEAVAAGDRSARSRAHDAPGELGALAGAVDRMADTLDRQEQVRRALVADVAHELRTPLAVALGECDAILDGVVDPDPARLASVREEIVRLGRLVEDLEALAAAEAATLQMEPEPLDLGEVIDDVLALHGPRLREQGHELWVHCEPAAVVGDALRLGQIVTNLISNAGKFNPVGGRIDVEVDIDGEMAVCTVTDDGPGIPPDEQDHLFERFWQGRAAADTGGSGIGLAVAAELARAHDGHLEAANAPGRGARFILRLPVG